MVREMNTVSFEEDSTALVRLDVSVVSLKLFHTSVDIILHI